MYLIFDYPERTVLKATTDLREAIRKVETLKARGQGYTFKYVTESRVLEDDAGRDVEEEEETEEEETSV